MAETSMLLVFANKYDARGLGCHTIFNNYILILFGQFPIDFTSSSRLSLPRGRRSRHAMEKYAHICGMYVPQIKSKIIWKTTTEIWLRTYVWTSQSKHWSMKFMYFDFFCGRLKKCSYQPSYYCWLFYFWIMFIVTLRLDRVSQDAHHHFHEIKIRELTISLQKLSKLTIKFWHSANFH